MWLPKLHRARETTLQCDRLLLGTLGIAHHAAQHHPLHPTGHPRDAFHTTVPWKTTKSCLHRACCGGAWHCLTQHLYLLYFYLSRQPAQPHSHNITLTSGIELCLKPSVMATTCPTTQHGVHVDINKCSEQVFSAQRGFHTAAENEILWCLAGKQCYSKTNKNPKMN